MSDEIQLRQPSRQRMRDEIRKAQHNRYMEKVMRGELLPEYDIPPGLKSPPDTIPGTDEEESE